MGSLDPHRGPILMFGRIEQTFLEYLKEQGVSYDITDERLDVSDMNCWHCSWGIKNEEGLSDERIFYEFFVPSLLSLAISMQEEGKPQMLVRCPELVNMVGEYCKQQPIRVLRVWTVK